MNTMAKLGRSSFSLTTVIIQWSLRPSRSLLSGRSKSKTNDWSSPVQINLRKFEIYGNVSIPYNYLIINSIYEARWGIWRYARIARLKLVARILPENLSTMAEKLEWPSQQWCQWMSIPPCIRVPTVTLFWGSPNIQAIDPIDGDARILMMKNKLEWTKYQDRPIFKSDNEKNHTLVGAIKEYEYNKQFNPILRSDGEPWRPMTSG